MDVVNDLLKTQTTGPSDVNWPWQYELRNIVHRQDYALPISCAASYSELFLYTPSLPMPHFVYISILTPHSYKTQLLPSTTTTQHVSQPRWKFPLDSRRVAFRSFPLTQFYFTCCHVDDETLVTTTKCLQPFSSLLQVVFG